MCDSQKKEVWFTPSQLEEHINDMNKRAEDEYHRKIKGSLDAMVESALTNDSKKH